MHRDSPSLRLLTVILRIVVLVAMAPVMGLGHAGHVHRTEVVGAVASAAMPDCPKAASPAGETHEDRAAGMEACPCCCSVQAVAAQAFGTVRDIWAKAARVASGADRTHPSVVPEAIPEPPRVLA